MGVPGKKMRDYRLSQELRLDIVASLYKRGYTYRDIRNEVMSRLDLDTYSLQTVHKDVNRLLQEWRETRIENIDYALQLELERIDELIKEAWAAWDKSKEDYEKKKGKQFGIPDEDTDEIKTVHMEQQREEVVCCGDLRYLELIHKLLQERRKLLGLYSPEKKEVVGEITFANLLMKTGIIDDQH